jgi:hypothetical protein
MHYRFTPNGCKELMDYSTPVNKWRMQGNFAKVGDGISKEGESACGVQRGP